MERRRWGEETRLPEIGNGSNNWDLFDHRKAMLLSRREYSSPPVLDRGVSPAPRFGFVCLFLFFSLTPWRVVDRYTGTRGCQNVKAAKTLPTVSRSPLPQDCSTRKGVATHQLPNSAASVIDSPPGTGKALARLILVVP